MPRALTAGAARDHFLKRNTLMSQEASGSPRFSFASGANIAYIEQMYEAYKQSPENVDATWRHFFEGFDFALKGDLGKLAVAPDTSPTGGESHHDMARVEAFINAYRRLGHLTAHQSPLRTEEPPSVAELTNESAALKSVDPQKAFHPANLPKATMTLPEIMDLLKETYSSYIGADFRELNDVESVTWLQAQMESTRNKPALSPEVRRRILTKLIQAEGFEQFLGRRYIGAKRFSLEGNDTLIPLLDMVATEGAKDGVEELCLGMAHRGRLNVLTNFMGKPYELMLKEFEGTDFNPYDIDGDVKYHLGFASEVGTMTGERMRLYLSPNPSHLEAVDPVVEGFVRARQRLLDDEARRRVVPILMHGDASMVGQGIVAETFNMWGLAGYTTGGTLHIIINNQIGFTTEPAEDRSTTYSSDIAKMVRAPVLHVNADHPEAVVWSGMLALAYRQKFQHDIVIDLIGYRRHGHNEGDEPAFTQPLMYKQIAEHPTALKLYADELIHAGVVTAAEVEQETQQFRDQLQAAYEAVHGKKSPPIPAPVIPAALQKAMTYRKATREDIAQPVSTGVDGDVLALVGRALTTVPPDFTINPKLVRILDARRKMFEGTGNVDWGFAELLALGSLAVEGHHVRFTGQDVMRGTFTSRHGVWVDYDTDKRYEPANHIAAGQAPVELINSPLSEASCLGYEFGYSVADPESLCCWEAQFGDFANGAQIIIDQFLSASEAKWRQTSGLTLLLPHGYEGQGPEHSSARPERFLQLSGNLNIQVAIPTTPAQHFHALRRQMHRDFRKPLVIMTPKSLLRDPLVQSPLVDFEKGRFHEVLDDQSIEKRQDVERIIFCSGKVYYDLYKTRAEEDGQFAGVPLIRLEQLYPFPYGALQELLAAYPKLTEIVWTQEEPQNMGGWNFVRGRMLEVLRPNQKITYVGRKNSGTPAEGSHKAHEAEQKRIIQDALCRASGRTPKAASSGTTGK